MRVNDVKHQAKLVEWRQHVAECRSSGLPVKKWCALSGFDYSTYYRWEREILGRNQTAAGSKNEIVPASSVGLSSSQPVLAELSIPKQISVEDDDTRFLPAAIIRIGRVELQLSNSAAPALIQQLKDMVSHAE